MIRLAFLLLLLAPGCQPAAPAPAEPTATPEPTATRLPTSPREPTASAAATSTARPGPTVTPFPIPDLVELTLLEHEFGFNFPDGPQRKTGGPDLEVFQGQRVRLTVINDGFTFHNIYVIKDGFEVYAPGSRQSDLVTPGKGSPGGSITIEFTAEQVGEFFYVCAVAGHREAGMEGRFIVKPRP